MKTLSFIVWSAARWQESKKERKKGEERGSKKEWKNDPTSAQSKAQVRVKTLWHEARVHTQAHTHTHTHKGPSRGWGAARPVIRVLLRAGKKLADQRARSFRRLRNMKIEAGIFSLLSFLAREGTFFCFPAGGERERKREAEQALCRLVLTRALLSARGRKTQAPPRATERRLFSPEKRKKETKERPMILRACTTFSLQLFSFLIFLFLLFSSDSGVVFGKLHLDCIRIVRTRICPLYISFVPWKMHSDHATLFA